MNAESGNCYGLSLPIAALGDTVNAPHCTSIATPTKANKRLTGLVCICIGSSRADYVVDAAAEVKSTAATARRRGLQSE